MVFEFDERVKDTFDIGRIDTVINLVLEGIIISLGSGRRKTRLLHGVCEVSANPKGLSHASLFPSLNGGDVIFGRESFDACNLDHVLFMSLVAIEQEYRKHLYSVVGYRPLCCRPPQLGSVVRWRKILEQPPREDSSYQRRP